ncbi:MAG: 4'-phosphopantetheinyl transferase superfamily protein [bacterium]|nr:4'-phosphopantetheinyl transferase superfamily protein [bacterium]
MIGNDVVDLEDPDTRPETFRPRFDERVFDPAERRSIAKDPSPHLRRWAHWAAKEAAYKLARQADDTFVFTPSRLVARFDSIESEEGGRTIRRGNLTLPRALVPGIDHLELRSDETSERVHVLAVPPGADWDAIVSAIERTGSDDDPSARVRTLACFAIARDLGVDEARVTIGRRGDPRAGGAAKIPTVLIDGSRSGLELSLSHHGRFVACAMTLRADPDACPRGSRPSGSGARGAGGVSGVESMRQTPREAQGQAKWNEVVG